MNFSEPVLEEDPKWLFALRRKKSERLQRQERLITADARDSLIFVLQESMTASMIQSHVEEVPKLDSSSCAWLRCLDLQLEHMRRNVRPTSEQNFKWMNELSQK